MVSATRPNRSQAAPGETPVESFLLHYIRGNPRRGFGTAVRATRAQFGVSRSTAAHYLSRLVRFGEVILLPDRTYVASGEEPIPSRPTLEFRRFDGTAVIRSDGSALHLLREEFRVVAGRLDHLDVAQYSSSPAHVEWECSVPARPGTNAGSRSMRFATPSLNFVHPLTPRDPHWQFVAVRGEMPALYRMVRPPLPRGRAPRSTRDTSVETEFMSVPAESQRFRQQLAPGAIVRLELIFPVGYPIDPVRFRVRSETEASRVDLSEERRIAKLSRSSGSQFGMRRFGSSLVLLVPDPLPDRRYAVEWTLPTLAQRKRWETGEIRRLRAGRGEPGLRTERCGRLDRAWGHGARAAPLRRASNPSLGRSDIGGFYSNGGQSEPGSDWVRMDPRWGSPSKRAPSMAGAGPSADRHRAQDRGLSGTRPCGWGGGSFGAAHPSGPDPVENASDGWGR